MRKPFLLSVAICILSLGSLHDAALAQSYSITDLGLLKGSGYAQATGVSGTGQAVGFSSPTSNSGGAAFLWRQESGIRALKLPSGFTNSAAWAINNVGDVIGQAALSNGNLHALLWTHQGRVIDLGAPKGSTGSTAYDLNDLDEVIGTGNNAFVWTPAGGFHDLGTLPGGTFTVGWRVNNAGEAVGFGDTPIGTDHAFLWTPKHGMKELRLLPGGSTSEALGNNNFRQIVGSSDSTVPNLHAALWNNDGEEIVDLGVLTGFVTSDANAINDSGVVVGECDYPIGHAFVWTAGTGMLDLNNLIPANSGWVLNVATFISPNGNISGYGTISGQTHAFVLTPAGN